MTMQLNDIFEKPIDRPIEGVIKADDNSRLLTEVEEYVLTNEIEKRLEEFLGAYNNYENANGAWISGFFGSGKSHLLKMLALLLENREIDGTPILDRFLPKCGDNEFLRGELTRAAAIPSKSILFNIDQKADIISKTEIDALLSVFVKVFDETCGYYGKQGHIAQMERDLDQKGLLDSFKFAYLEISGQPWEEGREMAILESENIDRAYAKVADSQENAIENIVERYRASYRVSIEDFAQQVRNYIDQQVPNFRLNFFVDEVGQYIAKSQKLRLNLQTIAESLATKCGGQAWIVVTAQEDMESVFGGGGEQQTNDYSRIQARFAYRMKLTSSDVAEVIQKRLLKKTKASTPLLEQLYNEQVNNFETLFAFADGAQTYRNYRDREHFISAYPFVPYQFSLFQSAIQNLSAHNAFEGKHSSTGERSMLGVFQQVAIKIGDWKIGQLAPFDLMFEGIRTSLKSHIQQAILTAETHLNNEFAVRVLKALFLVKYIKSFRPTVRNLRVLMLEAFDCDLPALRKDIQDALNVLEQQTYIERNGDQYEFLTNEEKDIEQEIKNTNVDTSAITKELADTVFDRILNTNKIRFTDNKQDYPFTKKLDGQLFGREHELTIHIISPFYPGRENDDGIIAQAMGRNELLVLMPSDDILMSDLTMFMRTEKYVRQNLTVTTRESVKRIIEAKRFANQERHQQIQKRVELSLSQSNLILDGSSVETHATSAAERITEGFQRLVRRTYPSLRMLAGVTFQENDVVAIIEQRDDALFDSSETLGEAEQEVLAFINRSKTTGIRPTLERIVSEFEHKPYGWPLAATLCCLAKLYALGKIEVRADGNTLENGEVEKALLNSRARSNTFVDPQSVFTPAQIRQLKDFYSAFFDKPAPVGEAKAVANETKNAIRELLAELDALAAQTKSYPFLTALDAPMAALREIASKYYEYYLDELSSERERLLELKQEILDPIRSFMQGEQRRLYDDAQEFLRSQANNLDEVDGDAAGQLSEILADPSCFKGDAMRHAKTLVDSLREQIQAKLDEERRVTKAAAAKLRARACAMSEFSKLPTEEQRSITAEFDALDRRLDEATLAAVIRDQLARFRTSRYPEILSRLASSTAQKSGGNAAEPVEYIAMKELEVDFPKPWLTSEEDIDSYLKALREAYIKAVKEGKRIQL